MFIDGDIEDVGDDVEDDDVFKTRHLATTYPVYFLDIFIDVFKN